MDNGKNWTAIGWISIGISMLAVILLIITAEIERLYSFMAYNEWFDRLWVYIDNPIFYFVVFYFILSLIMVIGGLIQKHRHAHR